MPVVSGFFPSSLTGELVGFGGIPLRGRNDPPGVELPCVFAGCICLPDVITLRGRNHPPGLVEMAGFCGFWRDWEGAFVSGGWCWSVFLLVVFVWLTLSPSWCKIALLVQNRPPATESPSNNRISLRVYVKSPLFGLDC